ncbi:MAG: YibE/F family protein [bacterium]
MSDRVKKEFAYMAFFLLIIPLPSIALAQSTPARGAYVPADLNLKTHPFVTHLRYGGHYRSGELIKGPDDDGWRLELEEPNRNPRFISPDNIFLPDRLRRPGQTVLVKQTGADHFLVIDVNRIRRYSLLTAFSLIVCFLVGGWITARSLIGVASGVVFLLWYALPSIVSGDSILLNLGLFYVITTLLVLPASLGLKWRTLGAISAALGSGLIGFTILYGAAQSMRLVGLRQSTIQVLEYATRYFPGQTQPISFENLLLAGILIGALGVTLDVCVDVTSSAAEISRSRPDLDLLEHLDRTLTVSSRLIGTMTNTLLLAYVGTDLFLLFTLYLLPAPGWVLLNQDVVALEILRGFGGALGFLSAAPLSILCYRLLGTNRQD